MTAPTTREDLMPCPFCGGAAVVEEVPTGLGAGGVSFSVGCDSPDEVACMGYQNLQTFSRRSEAVAGWNRRGGVAQAPSLTDAMVEAGARVVALRRGHKNCDELVTTTNAGKQPVWKFYTEEPRAILEAVFNAAPPSNQGASK